MFKNRNFKINYTSEEDNLYHDFYLPALEDAVSYDRAVGYFSISVLLNTPSALSQLVDRDGKIRIIFAKMISGDELNQLRSGYDYDFGESLPSFIEILENNKGNLVEYRIKLLAYLINTGKLEIKVALRKRGIFHQKIGIMKDYNGDRIAFSGSMNETAAAFDPEINSEEITLFKSWLPDQHPYLDKYADDFEKLWQNESSENTVVLELPCAIRDQIDLISQAGNFTPSIDIETSLVDKYLSKLYSKKRGPKIPKKINGNDFSIRDHQRSALNAWQESEYKGILELATGTGKTITSIYALAKLSERVRGLIVVISVPYVDLAEQWAAELNTFNIFPIKCFGNRHSWKSKLDEYIKRNRFSQDEFLAIVVVNKTLTTPEFQSSISNFNPEKLFFIGDECHHHLSKGYQEYLPSAAKYKLGLSATPFHYIDDEANIRLQSFYGDVVYKYTLYDAIKNDILTEYEYHPIPVTLSTEECDEYFDLSDKIGRLMAYSGEKSEGDERLNALLMRRARLIGTASNKLISFESLIDRTGFHDHSLVYCSDGKNIDEHADIGSTTNSENSIEIKQRYAISKILRNKNIPVSFFTSEETRSQRSQILNDFKSGEIQGLIAIRCLDEGIDVPACSTAYILASSKNPRQFIQRRGRILRKSPGKTLAKIYDFVVVLPPGTIEQEERGADFFKSELLRVADFAKHSVNHLSSLSSLEYWLDKYELHHLVL